MVIQLPPGPPLPPEYIGVWKRTLLRTPKIEDICRWLRRHDFQPPSGANDIGRMEFETPDRVLEYGVETDYFEIWERLPDSKGTTSSVQVFGNPLTLLLCAGEYAMLSLRCV